MNYTRLNPIVRKDTENINLNLKKDGVALDITGSTIYFTVKTLDDEAENDEGALIQKTVTAHEDAVNGFSIIALDTTDTDIPPAQYKYDIEFVDATGNVTTLAIGTVEFLRGVKEE